MLFKDNICKDNYFYFILLCRVLVVSVSWFFEIFRVPVSRRVVSLWLYPCSCFLVVCYKSKLDRVDLKLDSRSDDNDIASSGSNYYAVLGHLAVKSSDHSSDFPPSSSWLIEGQHIKWASDLLGAKTLSAEIIWKLKDGNYSIPKTKMFMSRN